MPKIIVLDNIAQEGLDLLEQADNIEYVVQTGLQGDDLKAALTERFAEVESHFRKMYWRVIRVSK